MTVNIKTVIIFFGALFLVNAGSALGEGTPSGSNSSTAKTSPTVQDIIGGVEKKYGATGFLAHFNQKSTLKALQITDKAEGRAFFKYPGMMRWEYEKPARQQIITDGTTLWIFRPDDNQVMIGKASSYFGEGKGASFLSDIKLIRKSFNVSLEEKDSDENYTLKLWPKEQNLDLAVIYLLISKHTFDVTRVVTYNSYGDETIIEFGAPEFKKDVDDSLFRFEIPDGADILSLD
jgi:outer membrane lipoprotein carrier protein